MRTSTFLSLMLVCFGAVLQCSARTVLFDDFDDASIDTTKWVVVTPYSDSYVTEGAGILQVEDGGGITSVVNVNHPLEILGRLQLSGNPYNNSKVIVRSEGMLVAPVPKGIAIQFHVLQDSMGAQRQLWIYTMGAPAGLSGEAYATVPLSLDTWYDFRIVDDGSNISLYWNGAGTPTVALTSSYAPGKKVVFQNREGSGNGSSISNDGRGRLDFIEVRSFDWTPFSQFVVSSSSLEFLDAPATDRFSIAGTFTLDAESDGYLPKDEALSLSLGWMEITIPPGSLSLRKRGTSFTYKGDVDGALVNATLTPLSPDQFAFNVQISAIDLSFTANPADFALQAGNDRGETEIRFQGKLIYAP